MAVSIFILPLYEIKFILKIFLIFLAYKGEQCQGFGTMLFEDKDRKVPFSVCRGEIINRIFQRGRVGSECFL